MYKKIILILLIVCILFSFIGCSSKEKEEVYNFVKEEYFGDTCKEYEELGFLIVEKPTYNSSSVKRIEDEEFSYEDETFQIKMYIVETYFVYVGDKGKAKANFTFKVSDSSSLGENEDKYWIEDYESYLSYE